MQGPGTELRTQPMNIFVPNTDQQTAGTDPSIVLLEGRPTATCMVSTFLYMGKEDRVHFRDDWRDTIFSGLTKALSG